MALNYEAVHEAAGVTLNAAIVEAEAVSAGLPSYTSVRSRETDSFEVFVQLFKQLLSATYTKNAMYVPFGNDVCLLGEKVPIFLL
jgi:hypothetical protein